MSAEPLGFASPAGNGNDSDFDYNYSTPNASNATYSTTAGAPTNVQNIVMYVLVAVDGIGCALNVLVFLVLIQVSLSTAMYSTVLYCTKEDQLLHSEGRAAF